MVGLFVISCSSYKQNIMFQAPEGFQGADSGTSVSTDYTIQKNDVLKVDVFSNSGERLIDPNPEMTRSNVNQNRERDEITYVVTTDGKVKLPMIGEIPLEGMTLRSAEIEIQKEYARFFKDPFVIAKFVNKRAILLGASGGQVIPLESQNMKLSEVLALGKGIDNNGKAHNIRVLRDKQTFLVDLTTIDGYHTGDLIIQPGDIIYVEPVRKPLSEATRDYGTLLSVVVSLASLIVIILTVN